MIHNARHDRDTGGAGRQAAGCVLWRDAADSIDRDGDSAADRTQEIQTACRHAFFAVGGEDMPGGQIGRAAPHGLLGFRYTVH